MPYKILIVDDEAGIVGLLQNYFEINGYLVLTARNGTEALKQVEKQPDLIIASLNL